MKAGIAVDPMNVVHLLTSHFLSLYFSQKRYLDNKFPLKAKICFWHYLQQELTVALLVNTSD